MAKKKNLIARTVRLRPEQLADIEKYSEDYNEGVFDRELRSLVDMGLRYRKSVSVPSNKIVSRS